MGNTASTALTCAAPPGHVCVPGTDEAIFPFTSGIDLTNMTGSFETPSENESETETETETTTVTVTETASQAKPSETSTTQAFELNPEGPEWHELPNGIQRAIHCEYHYTKRCHYCHKHCRYCYRHKHVYRHGNCGHRHAYRCPHNHSHGHNYSTEDDASRNDDNSRGDGAALEIDASLKDSTPPQQPDELSQAESPPAPASQSDTADQRRSRLDTWRSIQAEMNQCLMIIGTLSLAVIIALIWGCIVKLLVTVVLTW